MTISDTRVDPPAAVRPEQAGRPRRRRSAGIAPLRGLIPLVILLVIWQVAEAGRNSTFFPPPSDWATQTWQLWQGNALTHAILATLETFILSLVIATVLGTVIGVLVGRIRMLDRILGPILEYFRFLPGVALVPLAVLLVGYTESMKLYTVVFGAIWPVLLQVRIAARDINPIQLDVVRTLRLGRFAAARKIFLPSVVPGILLGIKITAPLTLVLVLVVEISTQVSGLGQLLETSQQNFQSAQVYGLVVIVGILAFLINLVMSLVENLLQRYRAKN
ncbi:MAG TPA: ABC transporter permease [Pseudonocardiaceae bacterium]|jgi:ABC-type nitrate/sulfonate/bicarbonate transport system permease component|nr:ABC transporter permease [Pseudonocardiaceae bacterium]